MKFSTFPGLWIALLFLCPLSKAQVPEFNYLVDSPKSALDFWHCLNKDEIDLNGHLYIRAKNKYRIRKIYNDTTVNGLYLIHPTTGHSLRFTGQPGREKKRYLQEIIFHYNDQNQVVEKIIYDTHFSLSEKHPWTHYMGQKMTYRYNTQGQVIEIAIFEKESYFLYKDSSYINYNPYKGNQFTQPDTLIKNTGNNPSNVNTQKDVKPKYKSKEEWLLAKWDNKIRTSKIEYNSAGKIAAINTYYNPNRGYTPANCSIKYYYNQKGYLSKTEENYHSLMETDTISTQHFYEYNKKGQLTTMECFQQEEYPPRSKYPSELYGQYKFQYNKAGKLNQFNNIEQGSFYPMDIHFEKRKVILNTPSFQTQEITFNEKKLVTKSKETRIFRRGKYKGYLIPQKTFYYEYEPID